MAKETSTPSCGPAGVDHQMEQRGDARDARESDARKERDDNDVNGGEGSITSFFRVNITVTIALKI